MSEAMTIDRKLEAVARAAWDADAAFLVVDGSAPSIRWASKNHNVQEMFRNLVLACLRGEPPNVDLWQSRNDRRRQLFVGIVRCTAAALGMTIVYPDGVVLDWSKPQPRSVSP